MSSLKKLILILIIVPILLFGNEVIETNITVYNSNLGLIQQALKVGLEKGDELFKIEGISSQVDPTSVHLTFPKQKSKIKILEQNYLYDLVNSQKIFEKYIGEKITCYTNEGNVFTAELLSLEGNNLIVRKENGGIRIINRKEIFDYNFPKLPGGLILKPTLQWLMQSQFKGSTKAELSYLTSGMSWHAEYVLILDKKDKNGSLSSWVSLENNSGASFTDSKLKLIAGEINRATRRSRYSASKKVYAMKSSFDATPPNFEERGLMDYHLYELQHTVDLKNKEIKQVSMFEEIGCKIEKQYIFSNYHYENIEMPLEVKLKISNTKDNYLGIPLPEGVVRIFKKDIDKTLQLVGEDNIKHTSKNDTLKLTVGKAFDVKGKRSVLDEKRMNRSEEKYIEIKIANNKDEKVSVVVEELHDNDWDVLDATARYVKKSNRKLYFNIDVNANSSKTIKYRFRRNW